MSVNETEVTCQNRYCRSINRYKGVRIERDPEYFSCPFCDQITVAHIEKGKYSGLCNYTGFLSKTPTGVINADGGRVFIDSNGRQYTREKFKEVHGIDPIGPLLDRLERQEVYDFIENWINKHARRASI